MNLHTPGPRGDRPVARGPVRAPATARWRAGAGLWVLLALAGGGPHARAAPAAGGPVAASAPRVDEFERLQFLGHAQPQAAIEPMNRFVQALSPGDPRQLPALLELGTDYGALGRAADLELTARRIEALSDRVPLARPTAMLLRGGWLSSHGEVGKAERQFIEAAPLLPPDAPEALRLAWLEGLGAVASRKGHFDAALARYEDARRIVDAGGPPWQRARARALVAAVLTDAGQIDRASQLTDEELHLAAAAGDELGLSRAWTERAIELGNRGTATLAAWRTALEHARRSGNPRAIMLVSADISDYYLAHGDFQTAYESAMSALPMARALHDDAGESVALANSGLALVSLRRKDEGMALLREALAQVERTGGASDAVGLAEDIERYLERAGYLRDALLAFQQSRQLSTRLFHDDQQRALIEMQESYANEERRHELDMLTREGRLKDEQIRRHDLLMRQWAAALVTGLLLLAVVAALARRLRLRNRQLAVRNEQLRRQAEVDPLTGLSNRHHLQMVMVRRHARRLVGTLYLIDADHFKQVNDACGHAGGDAVLVEVAHRLRAVLRDDDLLVRWGGEEFLVLVRPLPLGEAEALGQRLLAALGDSPVVIQGQAVTVTASIGYGSFPLPTREPAQAFDVPWERAIALLDAAMYLAKARGRNGACSVRRIEAADLGAFDAIVQALDDAAQDGRVELRHQAGPDVSRHAGGTQAGAPAAPRPSEPVR